MHGQTKFFDYLSKESLQRESVHGKTLRKITSDLKTLRKIAFVLLLDCADASLAPAAPLLFECVSFLACIRDQR
jgi:hypothetical protein